MEPVWGRPYADQCASGTIAHAPSIWRAMATGEPYRVRAFIADGNNTLMSYTNTRSIYEGLIKLDLLVVMDFFMTPTAQIADYVLPAATWLERPALDSNDDATCFYYSGEQAVEPPPDCWTDYRFYRELAVRMGQGEHWPWKDLEELYDYRLQPMGVTFKEFVGGHLVHGPELEFKKYEKTGFGTPSGKVELTSSILEQLGYDPLPGYQEPPESPVSRPDLHRDYPLIYFVGQRDHPFYLTAGRQIEALRSLEPEPSLRMHPETARRNGIDEGDWVYLETIGRQDQASRRARGRPPIPMSSAPHTAGGSPSRPRASRGSPASGSPTRRSSWATVTKTATPPKACRSCEGCCVACTRRKDSTAPRGRARARLTFRWRTRAAWRARGSAPARLVHSLAEDAHPLACLAEECGSWFDGGR